MRMTKMVPALLLGVAAAMVSASPAAGQTLRFEWPDTAVDVSTYRTVEECKAAIERVQGTVEIHQIQTTHVVPDTLPYDPDAKWQPLPSPVVETARTCLESSSAHADTLGSDAWKLLVPMYLIAGWDDSARAVVERRIAAVEPDSAAELKRILGHAGTDFFESRPPRYELLEEIVLEHVGKLPKYRDRIDMYTGLLRIAFEETGGNLNGDSEAAARGRRIMVQMQALMDSMPASERQQMVDEGADVTATPDELIEQLQAQGMFLMGRSFLRDTLRVSTEAYTKAVRELWVQATGMQPPALLGKRAPRLEGDVWLGCEQDPCEPYPRAGRITLVWFQNERRCFFHDLSVLRYLDVGGWCRERIPLRRIQDRFPELDIVVVAQSIGRHAYVKEGVTPEREAQLMRKWLDTFGLDRAVLTMTETQGWRLPEPDGRWAVRHQTANQKNYRAGNQFQIIVQDGYVVHQGHLGGQNDLQKLTRDLEFVKLIELLLEREGPAT